MTLYRIWCRFEPDHVNMPAGRRGQWRVFRCWNDCPEYHKPVFKDAEFKWQALCLVSTKPYPRGSIIRPHKELNRVLALRRQENAH